jgi:hypothetical protein
MSRRIQGYSTIIKRLAAVFLAGLAATLGAGAAHADNEYTTLIASSCATGDCIQSTASIPVQAGVSAGNGYAFASGWRGGFTAASASFTPGAAPLLQPGLYSNSAIADYGFTFQVQGAANTLVPLRMIGRVSTAAIHLTDKTGQVIDLVDGVSLEAPTDRFRVVANAYLKIIPDRMTPYPISSAAIDVKSIYEAGSFGGSFCQNCDGAGVLLDETIWVWSNSNINVQLDANVLLDYTAAGGGLDPLSTFGTAYAEADPTFLIEDAAYSSFRIVGVPNGFAPPTADAVPEPASWAMMILGLGLVSASMRRRTMAVRFT